jgi:D-alanyl-D-alanine dipeptidase
MLRADVLYKWGLVVAHNSSATPGAGSCIFLHIGRNSSAATAGCTAMPEPNLVKLLHWLDPAAHPILIQMPRQNYEALRAELKLPTLVNPH